MFLIKTSIFLLGTAGTFIFIGIQIIVSICFDTPKSIIQLINGRSSIGNIIRAISPALFWMLFIFLFRYCALKKYPEMYFEYLDNIGTKIGFWTGLIWAIIGASSSGMSNERRKIAVDQTVDNTEERNELKIIRGGKRELFKAVEANINSFFGKGESSHIFMQDSLEAPIISIHKNKNHSPIVHPVFWISANDEQTLFDFIAKIYTLSNKMAPLRQVIVGINQSKTVMIPIMFHMIPDERDFISAMNIAIKEYGESNIGWVQDYCGLTINHKGFRYFSTIVNGKVQIDLKEERDDEIKATLDKSNYGPELKPYWSEVLGRDISPGTRISGGSDFDPEYFEN